MKTTNIACALVAVACMAAGCKREVPVSTPAPAPASTPAPAPAAQPATPAPTTAPAPATPSPVESAAVTSATLGNAISADKRVTAASDAFRPSDTIYLAIETSGAGGASLTARWTFNPEGQATPVNEETQKVPPGGPSVTEFHVRKPDGWPPGNYQVVVLLNGEPAVTKKFSVK